MTTHHIAQMNVARLNDDLNAPHMAGFRDNLARINELGEKTAGFVWRLKDDSDNATSLQFYPDPRIIVNMSVWESIEALHQYTYYSDHVEIFRQRGDWFEKPTQPVLVLWWIPAGHTPTFEEGKTKLEHLQTHGVTPLAFSFKQRYTIEEFLAYQG